MTENHSMKHKDTNVQAQNFGKRRLPMVSICIVWISKCYNMSLLGLVVNCKNESWQDHWSLTDCKLKQEFSEFIRAGVGLYRVMKLVLKWKSQKWYKDLTV